MKRDPHDGHTSRRARIWAVSLLGLAIALVTGLLGGAWVTNSDASSEALSPSENSADAGFARDMQVHHAQAVRMSTMVRDLTDDHEVRQVALDILLTQQQQIGQMFAWLTTWGLSQAATQPMTWMRDQDGAMNMPGDDMTNSDQPDGERSEELMPGMATATDLRRLADARGERAERIFLELMIDHHRGGVLMARAALDRAKVPQVRTLARKIVQGQTAEIRLLSSLLAARGGAVSR